MNLPQEKSCNMITQAIFSSAKPKAQVTFLINFVRCMRHLCWRCRKLYTFSSSEEPQGQFQPILAQSTFGK